MYCSKGTYIRTLAADIAVRLGTLGYVRGLRRLSLDPFGDLPMYTLEELAERPTGELATRLLLPARSGLPGPAAGRARHRGSRTESAAGKDSRGAAAGRAGRAAGLRRPQRRFLGIVQGAPDGRVRPVRLFVDVGTDAEGG